MTTIDDLEAARRELSDARNQRAKAHTTIVTATRALSQANRPSTEEALTLQKALESARAAKHSAAASESAIRARLARDLRSFLPQDPTEDLRRLDSRFPITMFPVRVETKFDRAGKALLVRIYPDEIFANSHEPELTPVERTHADAYWLAARDPEVGEVEAWRRLLLEHDAARAAWIVRSTEDESDPGTRADSWSRAVVAELLPDRWIVVGYRGGREVIRAGSAPIVTPLALTLSPDTTLEEAVDLAGTGLPLDSAVAWTLDFTRALAQGMALRIPIDNEDLDRGFDRVFVVGVKTSDTPQRIAERIGALFDSHHYTRGIALVPQGTPTNNTEDGASAWPPTDVGGNESFRIERGDDLTAAGEDAKLLARALGVDAAHFAHMAGADANEQRASRAMNRVLFPATLGYFLDQMMDPVFTHAAIDQTRQHFVQYVRGRGPLPLFRVGNTPYAVLPTTSLARFRPSAKAPRFDHELLSLTRTLRGIWKAKLSSVPRIGRSNDPDADMLDALAMDASAREVRVRQLLGETMQWNLFALFGLPWEPWSEETRAIGRQVLTRLGHPEWEPRILSASFSSSAPRFSGPMVAEEMSETEPLAPNYLAWIRSAGTAALQSETLDPLPDALLYKLVRHCALAEVSHAGVRLLLQHAILSKAEAREPELVKIAPGTEERPTIVEHLDRPIAAVTGTTPLGRFLGFGGAGATDFWNELAAIENLPTAELERLLTETLDTTSHRLDAWITSLATKRLDELRQSRAAGSHFGAWAWIENLRPSRQPTQKLDDGRIARVSEGGFIHGPTMTHASAGAVLRSAHLSHRGAGSTHAIDLSSARARAAANVLEAVRNGQTLGAVLGQYLERRLHERAVEQLIEPLRSIYPVEVTATPTAGPTESITPRNVVDGLKARTAFVAGSVPFGTRGLPASGPLRTTLEEELRSLSALSDAASDALVAESVFQLVRGNTMAASASLDALARGGRPAEPEVLHAPTGGVTCTHRVVVLVNGAPASAPGWPTTDTPRATAEPRLDTWLGNALGDPRNVRARVAWVDSSDVAQSSPVSLDMLGLRAIDVVAIAVASEDESAASELDRRFAFAATGGSGRNVRIEYAADPSDDPLTTRTVPEVLDVARSLGRVLGRARPLAPTDLLPPDAAGTIVDAHVADDAVDRADAALADLDDVVSDLEAAIASASEAAILTALRALSLYGVAAAFPPASVDEGGVAPPLFDQARSAATEGRARVGRATAVRPATTANRRDRALGARSMIEAIFGRDLPLIVGITPTRPNELDSALSEGPTAIGDPDAIERWFRQVSRVRPALGALRKLRTLASAAGGEVPDFALAQLPYTPGARWIALPFTSEDERVSGRTSIVVTAALPPAPGAPWYGLLLDEWVEVIPGTTAQTGVAFHYDDPGAEAPQGVLIAVPPTLSSETWDFDTLVAILDETLELAKIRAVDGELLGDLGQLLPANYLSANAQNEVVSTRFHLNLIAEVLRQGDT